MLIRTFAVTGMLLLTGCFGGSELDFADGPPSTEEFREAWNDGKHESLQIAADGWEQDGEGRLAFIRYNNLIIAYDETTGKAKIHRGSAASGNEFAMTYGLLIKLYAPGVSNDRLNDILSKALSNTMRVEENGVSFYCSFDALCTAEPGRRG